MTNGALPKSKVNNFLMKQNRERQRENEYHLANHLNSGLLEMPLLIFVISL